MIFQIKHFGVIASTWGLSWLVPGPLKHHNFLIMRFVISATVTECGSGVGPWTPLWELFCLWCVCVYCFHQLKCVRERERFEGCVCRVFCKRIRSAHYHRAWFWWLLCVIVLRWTTLDKEPEHTERAEHAESSPFTWTKLSLLPRYSLMPPVSWSVMLHFMVCISFFLSWLRSGICTLRRWGQPSHAAEEASAACPSS